MSDLKNKVIDHILKVEGGYVNDPSDSGGETNFGITKSVARGYGFTGDMKELPISTARKIYVDKYWDSLNLDKIAELAPNVAKEIADTGVNMGIARAGKFLQRSLNVLNNRGNLYPDLIVDGAVGRNTLKALTSFIDHRGSDGDVVLVNMLNCLQGAFYVELAERREKDERFIYGWFKHRISI